MKSNNIELVNDVIDFIISDSPEFRERDSKVLFSTIFKEATEINIGDYRFDDDMYELTINSNSKLTVFVVKDHFHKWSIRNKALNLLGI
jgi:hypothetical protein